MSRAVGYFRVSTDSQARDDRNSFDVQRAAFHRSCAEHGYEAVGEYRDVMSGRKDARRQYQRMLSDARAGKFDVIVVTWLDRFGRNDEEIAYRYLELKRSGIRVEPTEESIPGFIELALTAWKAGQESKRTGDRVTTAMASAARRGVALGRAPYGYRKQWDYTPDGRKTNHRLALHEPEARWVRWAFEAYSEQNLSVLAIARVFNAEAPPKHAGKPWYAEEIRKLLRRRRYTGDWVWTVRATERREAEEIIVPGMIPQVVPHELYDAVQQRMNVKRAIGVAGRTQTSEYLLSGLLRCASCGGTMHGSTSYATPGQRKTTTRMYICARYRKLRTCDTPNNHEAGRVEQGVIDYLTDIGEHVEVIRDKIGERANEAHERLLGVKESIEAVDAKFARNMRLFDSGVIASEDQLAAANRIYADEKRRLEAERDRLLEAIAMTAKRQQEVGDIPEHMPAIIDPSRPVQERKALLQRYIRRVEIGEGDRLPVVLPSFFAD